MLFCRCLGPKSIQRLRESRKKKLQFYDRKQIDAKIKDQLNHVKIAFVKYYSDTTEDLELKIYYYNLPAFDTEFEYYESQFRKRLGEKYTDLFIDSIVKDTVQKIIITKVSLLKSKK